jgi:hypothetical protein
MRKLQGNFAGTLNYDRDDGLIRSYSSIKYRSVMPAM